ncbi:MAG: ribosomal protein S1p [Labilithrix sp.]|nr:ribosomal protein S1p [Labilithrix sp.]
MCEHGSCRPQATRLTRAKEGVPVMTEKQDSFAAMFEEASVPARKRREVRVGDRLEAVVVQVGRDAVFVELDGKQQAFLEAAELRDEDGTMSVKEGDKVTAHVIEIDEARGAIRLGRSMGKPGSVAALEQAKAAGVAVEGKVTNVNKGGLEVELAGVRAFVPMSQIDARRIEEAEAKALVGQSLRFLVTDIKDGGKNVVLSRRALLQREANESATRALSDIVPGAVLRGTVTGVRDFGAFVDLGGLEGLIPRSEVSHDRSVQLNDALKAGDTVEVQVREVKDVEAARPGAPTKKITLSLKALTADPWAELDIAEGRVMKGTVVRSTEFGRFVRLAPAIEGLLHVSELGKATKADEGEEILVVVKKIDKVAKKVSLVLAPDGAEAGSTIAGAGTVSVKVNAVVTGVVERIETYGVFVQIDGTKGRAGRGLVPVGELGVARGTDLRKVFPEGTKVTAKVLETGEGRLRLSVKGAKDAEERADFEAARGRANAPASLGTFADLLKGRKL